MKLKALYRAMFLWILPLTESARKKYNRYMIIWALGWLLVSALFISYTVAGLPFQAGSVWHKREGWLLLIAVFVVGFSVYPFRYLAELEDLRQRAAQKQTAQADQTNQESSL